MSPLCAAPMSNESTAGLDSSDCLAVFSSSTDVRSKRMKIIPTGFDRGNAVPETGAWPIAVGHCCLRQIVYSDASGRELGTRGFLVSETMPPVHTRYEQKRTVWATYSGPQQAAKNDSLRKQ